MEKIFEALASTPRRKILAYLSKTSLTAGEIAERFEMSKPAVSKHLKILENAGLINGKKIGQFVHYNLVEGKLVNNLNSYLATFCPVGGPLKKESAAIGKAKKARQ